MSPSASTFVLVNPYAGRGRRGNRVDVYRRLLRDLLGPFDEAVTQCAGDEIGLTEAALRDGYQNIVAIGGDGTWSVVADRIVSSGRRDVTLGLLPSGTGNDFGKSLGIRYENREAVVAGIARGRRRVVDVGRVGRRHFLNVVGLGFDIAVIDDAARFPLLKGDMLYQFCALRQLFRFPGLRLGVSNSARDTSPEDHLMLVIANANYFGGSFHIAPAARLDDGLLDAVSIYNGGPLTRARLFSKVAKGAHTLDTRVKIQQSDRFIVSLPRSLRYEVDGEVCEADGNRLEVSSVPSALAVFVPEPTRRA